MAPRDKWIPVVSREDFQGGRLLECAAGNGLWIGLAE
jgi:hypothetical protein